MRIMNEANVEKKQSLLMGTGGETDIGYLLVESTNIFPFLRTLHLQHAHLPTSSDPNTFRPGQARN